MVKEYVIVNKGRSIVGLRRHDSKGVKVRVVPESQKERGIWYVDLGRLEEEDIEYYKDLGKLGLKLLEKSRFNSLYNDELEFEEIDEEDSDEIEEEGDSDEEGKNEEEIEEFDEEDSDEDEELEGSIKEEENEEDEEDIYTEEELKEMEEDVVREIGEELGVGNYWNKNIDNLIEDILEVQ